MLEITTEASGVDHLMLALDATPGGAPEDYVTHKIVTAGTYTIDVTSDGTAAVDIVDGLTVGSLTSDATVAMAGALSGVTTASFSHTAPEIFFLDSTTSGEAKILISDAAGPDAVMDLQVDLA